ncbi:unnamed protein product [Paramecium pentaurelia]|uniref:Uncharacterized protein n=1 Tax=Paramecium pentaurelia TaxID=43138 RepID=A0A8S1YEM0_9CILI|nr:unnamed protein product [Paramecium pentaurelia]
MNDTSDSQMIKKENSNNQKKLDNSDSKANNQIKVYKRLIKNINEILNTFKQFNQEEKEIELNWTPFHYDRQKKEGNEDQSSKDKQYVINDGPLPLLGKVIKTKNQKTKKDGGNIQPCCNLIGSISFRMHNKCINLWSCVTYRKNFYKQRNFRYGLFYQSSLERIRNQLGSLGKNKMINIASALVLAGPFGIKEALQIGGQAFKSIQQIDITEFSRQIPTVTVDGLKKTGFWLSDSNIVKIQNQYQTLQMIQETVLKTQNNIQILNLATEVLGDQVRNGAISESISCNLYDLINQCFQQSKETINVFKIVFVNQEKNIQDYRQLKVIVTNQKRIQKKN